MPKYVLSAVRKETGEREDLLTISAMNETVAIPIGVSMLGVGERNKVQPGTYKARKIIDENDQKTVRADEARTDPPGDVDRD